MYDQDQEITEYYRNSITIIHNHKIHYSEVMVGGQLSFSVWFCVSKMFMMNVPAEIVTQGVDVMLAALAGYSWSRNTCFDQSQSWIIWQYNTI